NLNLCRPWKVLARIRLCVRSGAIAPANSSQQADHQVRFRRCSGYRWERRGFLTPAVSLFRTSLRTRGASSFSCSRKNPSTAAESRLVSSLSAHERAFTTISSRSRTSALQTVRVRLASPLPPRARELRATVETNDARRHHLSPELIHL